MDVDPLAKCANPPTATYAGHETSQKDVTSSRGDRRWGSHSLHGVNEKKKERGVVVVVAVVVVAVKTQQNI